MRGQRFVLPAALGIAANATARDGATGFGVDARPCRTIAGEAFNDAPTRIGIGDHPVQGALAKAMLGSA